MKQEPPLQGSHLLCLFASTNPWQIMKKNIYLALSAVKYYKNYWKYLLFASWVISLPRRATARPKSVYVMVKTAFEHLFLTSKQP